MDSLLIDSVVRELRPLLCGASLNKVHQPSASDIVLRLWNGRENLRLLLSTRAGAARMHLTGGRQPNPPTPPRFAQLLRSRLRRLEGIERLPGERIVRLRFAAGRDRSYTLVAELFGTQANLLLLDEQERIVDLLHRDRDAGRAGEADRTYRPPRRPLSPDRSDAVTDLPVDHPLFVWLTETVSPMPPLLAADMAAASADGEGPVEFLERFRERWLWGRCRPAIVRWQGRAILSAFVPNNLQLPVLETFVGPSAAVEAFYRSATRGEFFRGGRTQMEKVVRKARKRLERRLDKIRKDAEEAQASERQRQLGDLLLANLHRLQRGMETVELEDWYADPPQRLRIALDPSVGPQQNAEIYFRRHRKAKRAVEHAERRRRETLEEIDWLDNVALALEQAEGDGDYLEIRQELEAARLLPVRSGSVRTRKPSSTPSVQRGTTPGGYTIFWGRNNRSNDHVSRQLTESGDLWFHAHRMPGCHLVLKDSGSGEVPEEDVLFAASVAAGHSKGRDAGKVEVMVANGKDVRKPRGAKPGLVSVAEYRSVRVRPRKSLEIEDAG